jgi:hypothetical protein
MPKKISLVLLPIAFFFVLYGLSDNPASNAGTAPSTSAKPSASIVQKTSATPRDDSAHAAAPATAAIAAPDSAPPPAANPISAPSPSPAKAATRSPAPSASPSVATDQRKAVDQVAVGQYPSAAAIYRDLAQKNSRNKAYQEAARILSEHPPAQ